jgi:long-chain acyl-CoA synthetase
MTECAWLQSYPEGVPSELPPLPYGSLVDLLDEAFEAHADKTAYCFLGQPFSFADTERHSRSLGAYLQSLGLNAGDRVAIMMPNVPQYPMAVAAILRAGLVVVNVNPLYTASELAHQLQDSGAKAIFILENFAATLQKCLAQTAVEHVVLCAMGDCLGLKGLLVNGVVRHVKNMVPAFDLPKAVRFKQALRLGAQHVLQRNPTQPDDMAVLQYTGGTTGVSKGAVLLHRHLLANVLQTQLWNRPALATMPPHEPMTMVCALPLYHIYAFTVGMMYTLSLGGKLILIPNPRDIPAVIQTLKKQVFHIFPAVNTLFAAIARHPEAAQVDWRHLRVSVGGGMAVTAPVAEQWQALTGSPICEGYGLSEASPSVCCNPVTSPSFSASIGLPLPGTQMRVVDDQGLPLPSGQAGELEVCGPQVMAGYWRRPDETAKVITSDGWLKTGDIGLMDERGFFKIVDRKKDMILVSGFNVYPNEVEAVVAQLPGVLECACVGRPDPETGEAVHLFVVPADATLNEAHIRAWCREQLTGYKQPKVIEFRADLPKTAVGKVLRRALRDHVTTH